MSGLERPKPIPRENIGGDENASDLDDKDSNSSELQALLGHVIQVKSLAIVTILRPGTQQLSIYSVSYG